MCNLIFTDTYIWYILIFYWIFSKRGIEDQIYKAVVNKKDYTLNHFKKDLLKRKRQANYCHKNNPILP